MRVLSRRWYYAASEASVRRCLLPRSGSAVCVLGRVDQCLEVVSRSKSKNSLGIVIAANDAGLRQILDSRELRTSNVVGCVEPCAFVSEDSALIVSANCGEGVEAFTFDSKTGALPEMGRARLVEALDRPPHFLVFAGKHVGNEDGHRYAEDDANVLTSFARRVEGLFGAPSCTGAMVKGTDEARGRLVHARKSSLSRAGRLRVYRPEGAVVGIALLPKHDGVDVSEIAKILSDMCFGDATTNTSSLRRLWGAGDSTMGSDEQQVLYTLMRFYELCNHKHFAALENLLDCDRGGPTISHSGHRLIEGLQETLSYFRTFFARYGTLVRDGSSPAGALGVQIQNLRIRVSTNLAYATCTLHFGTDDDQYSFQVTNVLRKAQDDWRIAHQHASVNFDLRHQDFEDFDDDEDDDADD